MVVQAHLLTGLRLALALPIAIAFARPDFLSADLVAVLLAAAIASDYFDGVVARRYGTASTGGQLFDHATDCLFVTACLTGAALAGQVPLVLPVLIAVAFMPVRGRLVLAAPPEASAHEHHRALERDRLLRPAGRAGGRAPGAGSGPDTAVDLGYRPGRLRAGRVNPRFHRRPCDGRPPGTGSSTRDEGATTGRYDPFVRTERANTRHPTREVPTEGASVAGNGGRHDHGDTHAPERLGCRSGRSGRSGQPQAAFPVTVVARSVTHDPSRAHTA